MLEPVKDHTEWVNSYVIIEKEVQIDSSNAHTPGHTIKKKLRICLDPNEALEREPYYSRTVDKSCLLHHCRPGQRVTTGHITPRFPEVHLYGLRHWTFPVEETPHGNNRCVRCISKEAGFHLYWTPRSHRHR